MDSNYRCQYKVIPRSISSHMHDYGYIELDPIVYKNLFVNPTSKFFTISLEDGYSLHQIIGFSGGLHPAALYECCTSR